MSRRIVDPGSARYGAPDSHDLPIKHRATAYECRQAQREHYKGVLTKKQSKGRVKPVARRLDKDGYRLPTERELQLVERIATLLRFELPAGYPRELWFVRAFLNLFVYGSGKNQTPKNEVKRRCSVARGLAYDERDYKELAGKLGLPWPQAEILLDYGYQRVPPGWWKSRAKPTLVAGELDDWATDEIATETRASSDWFAASDDADDADQNLDLAMRSASQLEEMVESVPESGDSESA